MVHSILKGRYKVRVTTNGAKALKLAKVEPLPDVILFDVMIPQMDEHKGHSRCLSDGRTEVDDEARGFEVGAVDYIGRFHSRSRPNAHHAPRCVRSTW